MSKEQQNTQNAQEKYAEAIAAELIVHLKSGTAPWQKPWEPTMSGLPYNHLTGNTYSGSNTLKLMIQPYDDPRWLTYKQAQSVGAQVRKGSLNVLKHQYLMQTATLSASEKQHRTVLEHALEKTIADLPADIQMQARINFYRSHVKDTAKKYETAAERQAETGIER